MIHSGVTKRQLRSFGLIVGTGFAAIALVPLILRSEPIRWWAGIPALLLAGTALLWPSALRLPFRVWMAIGEVLAWVNTRVILGIVYYALVLPIGLFLRLRGKDPLHRSFDVGAETYRIPRHKRPATHMQRPY